MADAWQVSSRSAGVEFIDENGGGAGVRLRRPGKEKSRKLKDYAPSVGLTVANFDEDHHANPPDPH